MYHIAVYLKNIQSHKSTFFHLQPGGNFILAYDNNVGKSTIIKSLVLTATLEKASNIDLDEMLRVGEYEGLIQYIYNSTVSQLRIVKNGTKCAGFFETWDINEDNKRITEIIRTDSAPNSLLRALDIKLDKVTGDPLNIVEADAVQIISNSGVQSDNMVAQVLLDANVEIFKRDLVTFYKEVNSNIKSVSESCSEKEQTLASLTYVAQADDFFEEYEELKELCIACDPLSELSFIDDDTGRVHMTSRHFDDIEDLFYMNLITESFAQLKRHLPDKDSEIDFSDMDDLNLLYKVFQVGTTITTANIANLSELDFLYNALTWLPDVSFSSARVTSDLSELEEISENLGAMRTCLSACLSMQSSAHANSKLTQFSNESDQIRKKLLDSGLVIDCPVKGKVVYGENCIPIS